MQENNRSELERVDRERHEDFMGMLKGFVLNQVCSVLKLIFSVLKLILFLTGFFVLHGIPTPFCQPLNNNYAGILHLTGGIC